MNAKHTRPNARRPESSLGPEGLRKRSWESRGYTYLQAKITTSANAALVAMCERYGLNKRQVIERLLLGQFSASDVFAAREGLSAAEARHGAGSPEVCLPVAGADRGDVRAVVDFVTLHFDDPSRIHGVSSIICECEASFEDPLCKSVRRLEAWLRAAPGATMSGESNHG